MNEPNATPLSESVSDAPRTPHESGIAPIRAAILALGLLLLGVVVGYAFGLGVYQDQTSAPPSAPSKLAVAPVVKGMHISPDGAWLAFTGVFDQSRRAGRFVLELKNQKLRYEETPYGWQDYIMQWSRDGKSLLFEREKIPRPVAEAKAGFYGHKVLAGKNEPKLLSASVVPRNEKIIAGFWTPDDRLVLKTRREPKALYLLRDGKAVTVDSTRGTYLQNRAVREKGQLAFYVVRNIATNSTISASPAMALFRVQNGVARQISTALNAVQWAYVSDEGDWMIICRIAPDDENWEWELFRVTPQKAQSVKRAVVPADVIAVYWSPDRKTVFGSGGESLWAVDVPSLKSRRLGQRTNWHADDVAWRRDNRHAIVAADGRLWQMDVITGATQEMWRFPERFWS